jgi:hypothetical protein
VGRRIAILQSNYIPWRGYFDLIRSVDVFVFYDEVQYTKNDWRNRNIIVAKNGPQWLTVPIQKADKFGQNIEDAEIAQKNWARKHNTALQVTYGSCPGFGVYGLQVQEMIDALAQETKLSTVNQTLIRGLSGILEIDTTFVSSTDIPSGGDRVGRLIGLCQALGATQYVSGPAAQSYLDESRFAQAGIEVVWFEYPEYRKYTQCDGGYKPGVSLLDSLFHLSPSDLLSTS